MCNFTLTPRLRLLTITGVIVIFFTPNKLFASGDTLRFFENSPVLNKTRLHVIEGTVGVLYPASMTGLYYLWYKGDTLTQFHFFNDNNEWMQIDKGGHYLIAYYLGNIGIGTLRWAGVERKKAIWIGGTLGLIFETTFECMDGLGKRWGFSPGDVTANALGAATAISQQLAWDEQRINVKYSFHPSPYAKYRPNVFGDNIPSRMVKDYNGFTHWLSGNLYSFLPKTSKFPKWLNLAIGYGAEGMTGATKNMTDSIGNPVDSKGNLIPSFPRYRQYYISLDVDLSKIKTKSKFLHTFFKAAGILKFPAPTIELNKINGVHHVIVRPLYF